MKKDMGELLTKYPKIFRQSKLPMNQTCMCWGIATGSGWYDIIDKLCGEIQAYCDKNGCQIEATQVKEKFGLLRFYTNVSNDDVDAMIERAEVQSSKTCESCGTTKGVKLRGTGWKNTLCDKCGSKE